MEIFLSKPLYFRKQWRSICFVLFVSSFFLIAGCVTSVKPPYSVESYLLNYQAPSWDNPKKLATSVKFNRFSIAAAYNSTNMIFRNDAYSLDSFNYSRWAVNPADMVGDSLLSNMRTSSLFKAVFSRYETQEGRFVVSGGIEEFYLRIDKSNKTALISISISLQDTREKETGKSMLFQRKYFREEPLQDQSPRGYCQAASQAMQAISREIISDIYTAAKTTVE